MAILVYPSDAGYGVFVWPEHACFRRTKLHTNEIEYALNPTEIISNNEN